MASDARAKANPEGPRTWAAIALFLLFLIYGVDKYFYDIPNFLDDEFEENHTTQLKPRSETLPAATPHFDALEREADSAIGIDFDCLQRELFLITS